MAESAGVRAGSADVERRAADLAARLPEPLAPLARLAFNYRWSWTPGGPELFAAIDPEGFAAAGQNPVRLLQEASGEALARAAADAGLLARAAALEALISTDLARPSAPGAVNAGAPVAFFCAEFALHVSLPMYSGGLGALAGDFLKEASDAAVPFLGVGLMYRQGYFRQRIDASGWQHEYWVDTDPAQQPAALVRDDTGNPLTVQLQIDGTQVAVRIWRADVGRVPLFLLDTNCPANRAADRWITARLYDSDPRTRLSQYAVLGIGGARALRALGINPGLIHLNEGHAVLAALELARERVSLGDVFADALDAVRARTVFTTHTPVPAGNDTYPPEQIERATDDLATQLGVTPSELIRIGRVVPDDDLEPFGMTPAALRLSRSAGGVSRRHGDVARTMWSAMWPQLATEQVPIGHVTNGVHIPTWIGGAMRELLTRHLGADWMARAGDPDAWSGVDRIPDEELWSARGDQRAELVSYLQERSVFDRLGRGDVMEYVQAAADGFRPDVLTIGFARRVATYKRLDLLTRDPEWTFSLLAGDRPVQIVLAGKAHPRDQDGKRMLQSLFGLKHARIIGQRVIFLDDYDLSSAAQLVRGCDVWLNLPRPPLEASGTSGMKSAVNGGLQLSVLDGWWAEAHDGHNGWALPGEVELDHEAQDARHAAVLHRLLSDEVLPTFYNRDERGIPTAWLRMIRASLQSNGPGFSATRMLADYLAGPYASS